MKYPLLKSLLALGTVILTCSCSDDKASTSNEGGDVSFVPCEDAWYLPAEGFVIFKAQAKVTDVIGTQIGTIVNVPNTNVVIVKDMNGNNLIAQLDLADESKVKFIAGVPGSCTLRPTPLPGNTTVTSCEPAWYLAADKNYLIFADLTVTDEAGTPVGAVVTTANPNLVNMLDLSGSPIINGIDLSTLPLTTVDNVRYKITEPAYHLKDATGDYVIYPTTVVTNPSGIPVGYADFATGAIKSLDQTTTLTTANIAALPILMPNGKCVDFDAPVPSSSSVVTPPTPNSSSNVTPPTPKSSAQAKSSSSVAKSSSSVAKSSSSVAKSSSSVVTGGCPKITVKGGASGSGFASRYWDCCMPSCAWNENSGGNPTKACDAKGKNNIGNGAGSVCSGGGGATCTSQIPFTVDGCEEYGFAFAAVPASNGGQCGKCFQLTFTGEGHYNSTNANTKRLKSKGKKLIVMATNIGGDVQQGQFDILIPGGGVGMFNGCSQMGWGNQGQQYGGLLSDCETEKNYKADQYAKCLTDKCNKAFGNDTEAKKGCMFLVEWMESAGNPEHNYTEVECPDVLKQRYK
jgi:Glycosyl hydrolase family 45.